MRAGFLQFETIQESVGLESPVLDEFAYKQKIAAVSYISAPCVWTLMWLTNDDTPCILESESESALFVTVLNWQYSEIEGCPRFGASKKKGQYNM